MDIELETKLVELETKKSN